MSCKGCYQEIKRIIFHLVVIQGMSPAQNRITIIINKTFQFRDCDQRVLFRAEAG